MSSTRPLGHTQHVDFETRRIITGQPVTIDGHTFLVQSFDHESRGIIDPPHPGSKQDAFSITGRVRLQLEHAPWRGCPALDPADAADPVSAEPWSVWIDQWGSWWVFHAATGKFYPVARGTDEAIDAEALGLRGAKPAAEAAE